MIELVGYSTLIDKGPGWGGIVRFKRQHRRKMQKPPTERWLRAYARRNGYPTTKAGRCEPVYLYPDRK